MNNNSLQVFNNGNFSVRTIEDNGEIWFVAKDVAEALGYSESSNPARLFSAVPECWSEVKRIHTRSENGVEQEREMLCLTEQGLYFFLGRSDKKAALPYQMWIAGDVVPSIRKHGMYATPTKIEEKQEVKESRYVSRGIVRAAKMIYETTDLKGYKLTLALDKVFKHYTGESALKIAGLRLVPKIKQRAKFAGDNFEDADFYCGLPKGYYYETYTDYEWVNDFPKLPDEYDDNED
ncbi:MAG: hypothetical protein IJQ99_03175 [Synergistaceae bacterium]|nr:hypothetical protein [Synergistaceae bacterium]